MDANTYYLDQYEKAQAETHVLKCPECGEELAWDEEIYTTARTDHIVGCSRCLDRHDAGEWFVDTCDDYDGPDTVEEAS